ncbi:MAG: hypothetical protein Q8O86_13660 [Dehalococcoidia bacterium]|nr:hypothetical protein [Dehalococcoidia bacterium]
MEKAQDRLEKATGKRPPVQISQESSGASDHVNFIEEGIPSVDFNWTGSSAISFSSALIARSISSR